MEPSSMLTLALKLAIRSLLSHRKIIRKIIRTLMENEGSSLDLG